MRREQRPHVAVSGSRLRFMLCTLVSMSLFSHPGGEAYPQSVRESDPEQPLSGRSAIAPSILLDDHLEPPMEDRLPNLIIIVSDDQGTDASSIPHFGNELNCLTPRLAHFASEGRIFTNFRVNPKCSPTRAGLLTGRTAFQTGVTGVVNPGQPQNQPVVQDRASLQTEELTIAELLQQQGYATILAGKWHVGFADEPLPRGAQQYHGYQTPLDSGFDRYIDYRNFLCDQDGCDGQSIHCDCPDRSGDDHITWLVDRAIQEVEDARHGRQPYALFFWTIDPHMRRNPSTWWKVSPTLLMDPDAYDFNSEVDRYRAVVEAIDHEISRMLSELDVIDQDGDYRRNSNTVVFYLADNGTPDEVSFFGPGRAKGALYEGGIHVPMFVFGEKVPDDGRAEPRLVSHQDLFATIASMLNVDLQQVDDVVRDTFSFADAIGWDTPGQPERSATLSNRAEYNEAWQTVALTDGHFKLIAPAGGVEPALLGSRSNGGSDHFFDLTRDEWTDVASVQNSNYLRMRESIVDYWPTAVSEPTPYQVDIAADVVASINSDNDYSDRVGSRDVGFERKAGISGVRESRLLVKFDSDDIHDALRDVHRSVDEIADAQLILRFNHDSVLRDLKPATTMNYARIDADTGPMHVYPMRGNWAIFPSWDRIKDDHDSTVELGLVDLPPHILPQLDFDQLTTVPILNGSPISLGRRSAWQNVLDNWLDRPWDNDGIVIMTDLLPNQLPGDQRVVFHYRKAEDVMLRLTFER